jgi:uncharacterized protein YecT (DUF1311 family)
LEKAFITLLRCLMAALVVLSGPAVASDCSQQGSMPAIRRCLMETTDAEMETAYQAVLPKLATDEARKALEASQAVFIEYRYQSCTAVYEASKQFGWVADDYATNCVTRLNRQRQEFLLGILEAG